MRIAWERPDGPTLSCTPYFTWQSGGEELYAPGDHVLIAYKGPPPEVLLWLMNATGVDRAVLQLPPIHLNKFFSRVVHEHPTRFIGLCNVDESTAYTKENLDRLHVYVEELGLRGFYHEPTRGWEGYTSFPHRQVRSLLARDRGARRGDVHRRPVRQCLQRVHSQAGDGAAEVPGHPRGY